MTNIFQSMAEVEENSADVEKANFITFIIMIIIMIIIIMRNIM